MASANDFLSDSVTCAICLLIYDQPKSLPCGHTFCLGCIQRVSGQGTDDDDDDDGSGYQMLPYVNLRTTVTVRAYVLLY